MTLADIVTALLTDPVGTLTAALADPVGTVVNLVKAVLATAGLG